MNHEESITAELGKFAEAELKLFAKAFQLWEEEFRSHPAMFCSEDDVAAMGVSQLSADRAVVFIQYINDVLCSENESTEN